MLATNQEIYHQVLGFSEAKDDKGQISWEKFFEGGSMYKQIYNLEIIEELMEAGSTDGENQRVAFVEYQYKAR